MWGGKRQEEEGGGGEGPKSGQALLGEGSSSRYRASCRWPSGAGLRGRVAREGIDGGGEEGDREGGGADEEVLGVAGEEGGGGGDGGGGEEDGGGGGEAAVMLGNVWWLCRESLEELQGKVGDLMATMQEFAVALAGIDEATNLLAAEVARLREVIAGGGLGAAEEAEVLAGLGAIEAKLRALGSVPGEPGEPG